MDVIRAIPELDVDPFGLIRILEKLDEETVLPFKMDVELAVNTRGLEELLKELNGKTVLFEKVVLSNDTVELPAGPDDVMILLDESSTEVIVGEDGSVDVEFTADSA